MRHVIVLAVILLVVGGACYLALGRTTSIEGRVVLQDLDGREVGGSGAAVEWHPSSVVERQLQTWLATSKAHKSAADLRLRAARNDWMQKAKARDEAAAILRIAERSNSADVDISRARHREAAADAEEALQQLEKLTSGADEVTDPSRFLDGLPESAFACGAQEDGRFILAVPAGEAGFVAASMPKGGARGQSVVWLCAVGRDGAEELLLSNANVLTTDNLVRLARDVSGGTGDQGSY